MLRELNENEMMMVSGGSINGGYESGIPGTEQWGILGDIADFIGAVADSMGIWGTSTSPSEIPGNYNLGDATIRYGGDSVNYRFENSDGGWTELQDLDGNGSIDQVMTVFGNGVIGVDSNSNGTYDWVQPPSQPSGGHNWGDG